MVDDDFFGCNMREDKSSESMNMPNKMDNQTYFFTMSKIRNKPIVLD